MENKVYLFPESNNLDFSHWFALIAFMFNGLNNNSFTSTKDKDLIDFNKMCQSLDIPDSFGEKLKAMYEDAEINFKKTLDYGDR